ncbi:lipopolysaccharide biosynthesis protein [Marivivens donghaensis]|jgi:O-antigen/teichoic acid export membrane protein|uniref:lipopolysaccharide biosynthesis protein n=1 Tax=Marivivens donghaensis TaxID=1699413 RepID=UPI003F698671
MQTKKTAIKGSVILAIARVGTMVLGFGINVLLARILPIETLGTYFLLTSFAQVAALIALGGFSQSAVPMLSGSDRGWPVIRGSGLFLILSISVICGVAILFAPLVPMSDGAEPYMAILLIWIIARATTQAIAHTLRAFGRMTDFGLHEVFSFNLLLFIACASAFFLGQTPDLTQIVWVTAIAAILCVPLSIASLVPALRALPKMRGIDVAPVVKTSLPLAIIVIANTALSEAHLWIAGTLGDTETVALFGAALRVVRLLALPLMAVNMAIGPQIAHLWKANETGPLEQLLRRSATVIMAISLTIMSGLAVVGPSILSLIFGDAFAAAWPVFLILLVGQAVNATTGSPMLVLTVTDGQRIAMVFAVVASILGVGVSLILGRIDPLWGVAIGASVTVIVQNLLAVWYCTARMGIKTYPTLRFGKELF